MRRTISWLAAASLSVSASAAAAQTGAPLPSDRPASQPTSSSPTEEETAVEEVVVTAAPFGVAEGALTANVDVLNEAALQTAPATSLGDLVNGLPGVRSTNFAPGASRPVIRGLAGPRVQVLTNGLGQIDASSVSEDHQVATDPGEASRIEVVRGPATLAYGGSAIGGVVNIIDDRIPSTPAKDGLDGRLGGQLSSVDQGRSGSGTLKFGGGPWVFTAQGVRRVTEDYEVPSPPISKQLARKLGVEREDTGRVINSAADLTEYGLGGAYVTDRGFAGLSIKQTDSSYGTVAEQDVTIDLKQTRVDARGEIKGSFGPFDTFRLSTGYADYQHTEFEGEEPGTQFLSQGFEGRAEAVQRKRGSWQGAFGLQGLKRDFDAIGDEAFVPQTTIKEAAVYTVQRVDRGPLGFEGGLRVDRRKLSSAADDRAFTNVSASGGVFVRPRPGLYLGLSAARNQRAPNEVELFADGPHVATGQFEIGNPRFYSETANSLEGAVHYGRGRLSADLHLFYARYDDFIDLRPTSEVEDDLPVFQYTQTNATFRGFEAELGYKLWTDGDRSVSVEGSADSVRGDTDLGPPARIPPWSATGRVVYAGPRIEARAEVRRVGEQDRTAAFELLTDGYTLANLYGSIKPLAGSDVTLFAEVRNLTDEEAREHASALKDIAPLPGRNFRAGIAYRF